MNILHVCVTSPYTDGWNYQENVLTKYHVLEGHDVHILASQWSWDSDGKLAMITKRNYINKEGVTIIRLPIKNNKSIFSKFKTYINFENTITDINPDIIFIHNLQFVDIKHIANYAKHNKVKIFADNHGDFTNSARSFISKVFYKTVWRHYAHVLEPYTAKFFGVLPKRVDFLLDVYKLPSDKCELLIMGADDEFVKKAREVDSINGIRAKYKIKENDFLIVTGGKIDEWKLQTLLLMEAVANIKIKNVKLIIFGSISQKLQDDVRRLCIENKVIYIGWLNPNATYDYFASADLVIFPGRHSVFWEQVAGQGIPMICKYWDGYSHIDAGGNVKFLYGDSIQEMIEAIEMLLSNKDEYNEMKKVALNKGSSIFSYRKIAQKCLHE